MNIMTIDEKVAKLEKIIQERKELLSSAKTIALNTNYEEFSDWISGFNKTDFLFLMFEFSRDEKMNKTFEIMEGYYIHKYKKTNG